MTDIADILALATVRTVTWFLAHLPNRLAHPVAYFLIRLSLLALRRSTSVARKNLAIALPSLSEVERERVRIRSLHVLAEALVGFSKMPQLNREQLRTIFDFKKVNALADQMRKRSPGVGLLVATMHFGNFELLAIAFSAIDHPIDILARGFGLSRLDAWWNSRRTIYGNRVFNRVGGYAEVTKRVRRGRDVALLVDQNVKRNHAIFVDFFGIPTATTKTIAIAALRTGAQILLVADGDAGEGRHKVLFREIKNLRDENGSFERKVELMTAELNHRIEEIIRQQPERWFWIHRRFKTRPLGESENVYSR